MDKPEINGTQGSDVTHSLTFMILSDSRLQNKRQFKLLVFSLLGWLLTVFAFVGYIMYDRWFDSQVEVEETYYQTQSVEQDNISGINREINNVINGGHDGFTKDNNGTNLDKEEKR